MNLKLVYLLSGFIFILIMPAMANTVYLLRHAEKQDSGTDPALTVCGQARADALATYFAGIKLQKIYSTAYQRTQQTVAAIAKSKQLTVTEYDPRQPEQLLNKLTVYSDPALVVGHSNTVPQLVSLLTGIEIAPLSEQDYTMLYQVELGKVVSVTLQRQTFNCYNEHTD